MRPLHDQSDRLLLTVRVSSDGHREWLNHRGTTALVYFERGSWWARRNDKETAREYPSEMAALDALIDEPARELRRMHGLPEPKVIS